MPLLVFKFKHEYISRINITSQHIFVAITYFHDPVSFYCGGSRHVDEIWRQGNHNYDGVREKEKTVAMGSDLFLVFEHHVDD